jgi:sarcosine oxidase
MRECEPALSWTADKDGVTVTTPLGAYHAGHLVLCVGARTLAMLNGVQLALEVERQSIFWFEPDIRSRNYDASRFPIYAHEYADGEICYGFPRLSRGVKASIMHSGERSANADDVRRSVEAEEVQPLRSALAHILPELARAPVLETDVCIFTNTPDHDFVIDFHPESSRVVVSSACSGHGYKFASAIGEIQADLVTEGKSRFDLSPFGISRKTATPS